MSYRENNVRPLIRGPMPRPRRYRQAAQVLPLHPPGAWPSIAYSLLVIFTATLIAAMIVVALRSGSDVIVKVVERWPWW